MKGPGVDISPELENLIEEFAARLQAGEAPDVEAFAADHPEQAEQVRRLLPTMLMLADLGRSEAHVAASLVETMTGVLGDYRILREVGRGGMGVVYEAEQISLGRPVALKVLPFAATMDSRQLQRFHNEARAAASLHHEHIVPVYAVGCERGVHYYAMQFIEGLSLADLLARQHAANEPTAAYDPAPAAPAAETAANAATERQPLGTAHFRRVAEWGVQAAKALEHAHALGIVHRDVKPANLLLDRQGKLWVTDFGLARTAADPGVTLTGDVLGTLRYMSPEQALAKHGLVDHRTDVYSLGVTLYELLTGSPAVEGKDRECILNKIATAEPLPPRTLNPAIPVDLETVLLKAMAKEPGQRYATARELAEDLRRFLDHRPVLARRPALLERAARWSRRHTSLVAAVAVLLALAAAGLAVCTLLVAHEQAKTRTAYEQLAEEQARTQAALEAEAKERARAEESFRQARQVVDFFTQVTDEALLDRPELRRMLLEALLAYYQDFIEQHRDDPTIRAELTASQFRVANLLRETGARADAEAALEQARLLEAELFRDGRPPHGFGRGGPRGLPPFGPRADSGTLFLLGQKPVQEDLKLSEEQVRKVADLSAQRRDLLLKSRTLDGDQLRARLGEMGAQEKALVLDLSQPQARRLRQIALQQRGPHALADAEVAAALKLTGEQREQIRSIQDEARKAMWGPSPPGRRPPGSRRGPERQVGNVTEQLLGVLTAEQKVRWKEMTGEPFQGDVWPRFGGPFGPGREFGRPGRP